MSQRAAGQKEIQLIRAAVARLRAAIMALVFGFVGGTSLAVATLWLVVRGGRDVGQHLGLFRNYFPGYTVTWTGGLLGFFYGALVGAGIGWTIAWIYNKIADWRLRD